MINATIEKFGYPRTLVAEYVHWVVLLRPTAPTLGSLILAAKGDARAYRDLPRGAFAEQGAVIGRIETALAAFMSYEKINYLILMMVDPHVHFHVVPRYDGRRSHVGADFVDAGWPGLPDLATATAIDPAMATTMIAKLREHGLS